MDVPAPRGYRFRWASERDAELINDEFNRVFRMERTLEEWRWKFPENPWGWHAIVAESETGEFAGHYAMTRLPLSDGTFLAHAVDSFVSEPHQRRGLFSRMGEALLWHNASIGARASYGFPNPAAIPGHRRVGWQFPLPLRLFARPVRPVRALWRMAGSSGGIEPVRGARAGAEALDALGRLGPVPDGTLTPAWDASSLAWRLARRPERDYEILAADDHAVATTLVRYGRISALVVMLACGRRDADVVGALNGAARLARARGCDIVIAAAGVLAPRTLVRAGFVPTPRRVPLIWSPHAGSSFPPDVPLGLIEGDFL